MNKNIIPALLATALALAGCTSGLAPAPTTKPTESVGPPPTTSPTPAAGVSITCPYEGRDMTVRVGPLVRLSSDLTALPLTVTGDYTPWVGTAWGAGYVDWTAKADAVAGPYGVRLVDLDKSTVREAIGVSGSGPNFFPDSNSEAAYFGPVDTASTAVLIPMCGLAEDVPVVDSSPDQRRWIDAAAKAKLRPELGAPVAVSSYITAADDAVQARTDGKSVEVTFASDALFAYNKADLSSGAQARIDEVSSQLAKLGGGTLGITGHTDDVGDAAYNLDLSKRRAEAVRAALAAKADLKPWQVTVTGLGETKPKFQATNDQARAANRRVEIVISASTAPATVTVSSEQSESTGPTAAGAAGVVLKDKDRDTLRVRLDSVQRRGKLLVGRVEVTTLVDGVVLLHQWFSPRRFSQYNSRGEVVRNQFFSATGLTLLRGGQRVHPVDYPSAYESGARRPLTELSVHPYTKAGSVVYLTAIWPDSGGSSVVLDQMSDLKPMPSHAFRLTDIPVS